MYEITSEIIDKDTTQKWLDPGIHSDLELIEIKAEKSPTSTFLAYTYANTTGQKVTRTEWEVNSLPSLNEMSPKLKAVVENMATKEGISNEKASELFVTRKRNSQMQRILKVASLFVPEVELKGNSFKSYLEFITFVKSKIGDSHKGVKLRMKLTYDREGYVNTPDYVRKNNPWIERMDAVSKADSVIAESTMDTMVRPAKKGTRPPKKESPLEESTPAPFEPAKDDTPF